VLATIRRIEVAEAPAVECRIAMREAGPVSTGNRNKDRANTGADTREPATAEIVPTAEADRTRALSRDEDLPVVARMVIEIRSDGTRTVARGAVEDVATGQQAALVARGGSPIALAADLTRGLARSLGALPFAASSAVLRRLLGRGRRER
jgi:hypothetical protein